MSEIESTSDGERLEQLAHDIGQTKAQFVTLVREGNFATAAQYSASLAILTLRAEECKAIVQQEPLTTEDVKKLRSISPCRKSVQNLTDPEVAGLVKFEKLLGEELGEKSPFEMRQGDNAWREDESKSVPIIKLESHPTKAKVILQDFQDTENNELKGGVFANADTGIQIEFDKRTINEIIAKSRKEKYTVSEAQLATIYHIPEVITNAVCFDTQISEKVGCKSKHTLFMHKLYVPAVYHGKSYLACLSIEEYYKGKREETRNRLYCVKGIKIAPGEKLALNGYASNVSQMDDVSVISSDATSISIQQLYAIVKTHDKLFFENFEASGRDARLRELREDAEYREAEKILSERLSALEAQQRQSIPQNQGGEKNDEDGDEPGTYRGVRRTDRQKQRAL